MDIKSNSEQKMLEAIKKRKQAFFCSVYLMRELALGLDYMMLNDE
jgi:hypothetical protein